MDDISALEAHLDQLLGRLDPAQRLQLARKIGRELQPSQSRRIAAQRNPDGSAYTPRKEREPLRSRQGSIRRRAGGPMFRKLRQRRYLGMKASPAGVEVGFLNDTVARIARVHQLGLRDRVNRQPGAPETTYPQRELIGFTEEDRGRVLDRLLEHLQA